MAASFVPDVAGGSAAARLDVEPMPAARAIRLGQSKLLDLHDISAVGRAGQEGYQRARLDCEAADPAHPAVAPERRFDELCLLPGHFAVSAQLNFAHTSVAGIGDAGDVVLTCRNG